ncbi:hypothetical protein [Acetonema longum]|uniref:Uncharacterized protein n=1 Tax=Acetonema longum DSM 6540 TaxID=1009370 RepID=F7NK97_9FIRM|nr:hypothetical protein [Acetonema longum]EGO63538.1 hypothetical protein ALO_12551 [Acetonema longum DSM 6540]
MTAEQLVQHCQALTNVYRVIAELETQPLTEKDLILDKLQYISAVKARVGRLAGEALELAGIAEAERKSGTAEDWVSRHREYITQSQSFTAKQLDMEAEAAAKEKRLAEARALGLYEKLKNLRSDLESVENTLKFRGRMLFGDWKDA